MTELESILTSYEIKQDCVHMVKNNFKQGGGSKKTFPKIVIIKNIWLKENFYEKN